MKKYHEKGEYPYNYVSEYFVYLQGEDWICPMDFLASFAYVMEHFLNDAERELLLLRYKEKISFPEIRKRMNLKSEYFARHALDRIKAKLIRSEAKDMLLYGIQEWSNRKTQKGIEGEKERLNQQLFDYRNEIEVLNRELALLKGESDEELQTYVKTDEGKVRDPRYDTLEELPLSKRAYHVLHRMGCKYVKDVMNLTDEDLLGSRNCGAVTAAEIKNCLAQVVDNYL